MLTPAVGAAFLGAFLASLVEFVEAATIVLAVGSVRGWRSALVGAALGAAALSVLVLVLGPALGQVPERVLQLVVGVLLLLFGMRWLRKAILRAAGVIALHDEEAIFRREAASLRRGGPGSRRGMDPVALATAFKAVLLEGVEVAFIVIAVAAGGAGLLPAAVVGAAVAAVLVAALAFVVHRPLARVPENTLKFVVGGLMAAFGIFWTGEGLGVGWPGHDLALLALIALMLATGLLGTRIATRVAARGASGASAR